MNARNLFLALAGLIAGGLLAFVMHPAGVGPASDVPAAQVSGKALIGGPFTLTDETGKRVTEKDFLGHPLLIFFGYTHCPDICPSSLQVISAAIDKLGSKGRTITPVFISLDGERDTPEKLAQYVKSFHPRLAGLSGNAAETAAVASAYRVFYQKIADPKSPADYTFDHAAITYLMGADGNFITHIAHTTDVDEVVSIIDKAL